MQLDKQESRQGVGRASSESGGKTDNDYVMARVEETYWTFTSNIHDMRRKIYFLNFTTTSFEYLFNIFP